MRSDRLVQMGVAAALFGMCFTKIGLGTPMLTNIAQIGTGTLYLKSLIAQDTVNNPTADQIYIRTNASQQNLWGPYTMKRGDKIQLNIPPVYFGNSCTVDLLYVDKNNGKVAIGETRRVLFNSPSPGSLTFTDTNSSANYTLNYEVKNE